MSPSKVLVLGNYRQTLTVIRSLAKAGYHIIVGRGCKRVFTQYSRYTAEIWPHPEIESSENDFIAALVKLLSTRGDIDFVFPVGEEEITCLIRHRDVIPPSTELVMAEPSVISACLDKFGSYELAARLGVPQAPRRQVHDHEALISAMEEIGYPCVVKPNDSSRAFFGKKALIIHAANDFTRLFPAWPEENKFLLLQRWVPGYRHNCHFVADRGRLLAYFEQRVLRTDRRDGTGYGVDGISVAPSPALKTYCESLAMALNYSGAGSAQFLVDDRAGLTSFLEINPRLDATCALPYYCGYDFPRMAVLYAEYRRGTLSTPIVNFSAYPAGRRAVWLRGDILGWVHEMSTGALNPKQTVVWLKEMTTTFFRGDYHLTWSWNDPLPACFFFASLAKSFLRYLMGKILFHRHLKPRDRRV